jgi:UDP-N-acetylenolpyruvoylglucosamine reductase
MASWASGILLAAKKTSAFVNSVIIVIRSWRSVIDKEVGRKSSRIGKLIEAAGLKGTRAGAAEISTVHANFIVNHGDAKALDVLCLIERARSEVAARTGTVLETEVKIIGTPAEKAA